MFNEPTYLRRRRINDWIRIYGIKSVLYNFEGFLKNRNISPVQRSTLKKDIEYIYRLSVENGRSSFLRG